MSVLIRHETLIKSVKVHVGNTWHGRDRTVYGNARFVYEGKKHEEAKEINIKIQKSVLQL